MVKSAIAFWCSSLCALTLCSAAETRQEDCGQGPRHMRAALRYTAPKGIGYNKGYTTLEAFFAPQQFLKEAWLPFLDLRGHVFDNGKFAANVGMGLRYLAESRVWGANAYYDYRNANHHDYDQVAAGLETLGRVWDFRINGYLPVGRTHSTSGASFFTFQGHHLVIQRKRDFAMKGVNAEAGAHVDHFKNAPLYFAAGPYYLRGPGQTAWGGELRAVVDLFHRHLRIEGNTSYDNFFKWIGQGQVSINVFFGGKKKVIKKGNSSCSQAMTLQARALQRVDRSEIIPVVRQHVNTFAINPATGQPWFFWFVNNTSSSAGTYESPYPTLFAAQNPSSPNDVIYVYPGDGTTNGMNMGITLKNAQMLLGASTSHPIPTTMGTITIPPLASSLPSITNTTGDVVTLANNNTVSGFYITANNGNGITGTGISNFEADRNTIVTTAFDTNGINLLNPSGQVVVNNSIFSGFTDTFSTNNGDGIYVELDTGNTLDTLSVAGSSFNNMSNPGNQNGGVGIFANVLGGTITSYNVTDCTFSSISTNGTGILAFPSGMITNFNVSGCTFTDISDNSNGVSANLQGGTITNVNVSGSTFNTIGTGSNGIDVLLNASGSTVNSVNIMNCTFSGITGVSAGISVDIANTTVSIPNTTISNCTFSGISGAFPTAGLTYSNAFSGNATITGNTFTGGAGVSTGFAAVITARSGGTTCLDFAHNNAIPTGSPASYQLEGNAGTLNRTTGSDGSMNTGQFNIVQMAGGTVGNAGSCSQ